MEKVTTIEIAKCARVSHATVSRVLNDRPGISLATRDRVLEVAKQLGYSFDDNPKSVHSKPAYRFKVLLCNLHKRGSNPDEFWMQVIRGANQAAQQLALTLDLDYLDYRPEDQLAAAEESGLLLNREIGAWLIMGLGSAPLIKRLNETGKPVVLVAHEHKGIAADAVFSDEEEGARLLVERLVAAGHTRIGWLGGSAVISSWERRLQALRYHLFQHGLTVDPRHLHRFENGETEDVVVAARQWLALPDRPSAIVVPSSWLGLIIQQELSRMNLRCPEDLSIASFDDCSFAAMCNPALTRIATFPIELGRVATNLIYDRLSRPNMNLTPMKLTLPIQLRDGTSIALHRE